MKLLTNKNFESIFSYFPGIDYPNAWTIDNPAVYHYVKDGNNQRVILSKFTMLSQEKYLLVKAQGGVNYKITASFTNNNYSYQNGVKFFIYDYLNYWKDDVLKNKNALKQFVITNGIDSCFSFNNPRYLLIKIMPNNQSVLSSYNSNQKRVILSFNNKFIEFDYSTHWIRDWVNRVDGTTWGINGKLNSSNSLYYLNKNVGRIYI